MNDKPMGVVSFCRFVDQFPSILKFVPGEIVEDLVIIGLKFVVMGFAEFGLGVEVARMTKMVVEIECRFCEREWGRFEARSAH